MFAVELVRDPLPDPRTGETYWRRRYLDGVASQEEAEAIGKGMATELGGDWGFVGVRTEGIAPWACSPPR